MIFNSLTFLLFFAVVLGLHQLPIGWRLKKFQLLIASYLFYAAWNPPFVALIWLSTIVDWKAASWMADARSPRNRKAFLCLSLCTNLGLLGYFKYGGFLLESFAVALTTLGVAYQPAATDIVLPVGISFYTFQTLSYTLDVYRGKLTPWKSPLDFALYVTFFPQLVAGPIVRAVDFLPQLEKPTRTTRDAFAWGLTLLVIGLFGKVVLADGICAPVSEKVYDSPGLAGFQDAWLGTLAFASQIFFDFAGYSTCAIGVALCLGFRLPTNFRSPYAAVGFSDFWGRWHITLSSWLRDYLYIPLGGNRKGNVLVNLMLTMLLGGLWHGAGWTFVAWGGLHGSFLVGQRLLSRAFDAAWLRLPLVQFGLALVTYGLVCLTWVFFRASNFDAAWQLLTAMLSDKPGSLSLGIGNSVNIAGVTLALLAAHWYMRQRTLEEVAARVPWWGRALVLAIMLFWLLLETGDSRAFIYFQF